MKVKFNNNYLEILYLEEKAPGKPKFSVQVVLMFKKTILLLQQIENVDKLRWYNGLNFEKYKEFYSVRVDKKYRLLLTIEEEDVICAETLIVEELTNHYR